MPRSGPRAEVSSLIAIGNIPRAEMSGIISLGNMNAVSASSQRPSGPRHLGPTPPPPKPSANNPPNNPPNWQLDTQSPSWFDRYDGAEPALDSSPEVLPSVSTSPVPSEPDLLSSQTTNVDMRKPTPAAASKAEPSFSLGGDDDDDGFTLSDDIGGPHSTGPYKPANRDGGHVGLIVFLVLVIGGAAAAYWFWWLPSQQAAKNHTPPTTAPTSAATLSNTTNPTNPTNAADTTSADPDTSPASTSQPTTPTVQTPAAPPPPLPDAFSSTLRQRAVARAILNHAQALFDDTKFKEAQAFLTSEYLSLPSIVGALQDLAITRLATTQRAQELVGSATADLGNLRCDRAEASITELASISSPAASQLQPKIKACKRKLEAPPTKIPD